jgi:hypothetical protein
MKLYGTRPKIAARAEVQAADSSDLKAERSNSRPISALRQMNF